MLKPETYLLNLSDEIVARVKEKSYQVTEHWKVRIQISDIFDIYQGFLPRASTLVRFPQCFDLDVYFVEKQSAIRDLNTLKREIRADLWWPVVSIGSFLHAPDSREEYDLHVDILSKRIIASETRKSRSRDIHQKTVLFNEAA